MEINYEITMIETNKYVVLSNDHTLFEKISREIFTNIRIMFLATIYGAIKYYA